MASFFGEGGSNALRRVGLQAGKLYGFWALGVLGFSRIRVVGVRVEGSV